MFHCKQYLLLAIQLLRSVSHISGDLSFRNIFLGGAASTIRSSSCSEFAGFDKLLDNIYSARRRTAFSGEDLSRFVDDKYASGDFAVRL
jgi:hypothetical protein